MFKKFMVTGLAVVVLATTSLTAFAITGISTPAGIVATLTGKSIEEVKEQKFESGETYGKIAYDDGIWNDFNKQMLESKKAFLDKKVADGTLTQEQVDEIYANILERQEFCKGNGTGGKDGMMGYGFGNNDRGQGHQGQGQGRDCGSKAWQ